MSNNMFILILSFLVLTHLTLFTQQIQVKDFAIPCKVEYPKTNIIKILWEPDPMATKYDIYFKLPEEQRWELVQSLDRNATHFEYDGMEDGLAFEFKIERQSLHQDTILIKSYQYFTAGNKLSVQPFKGVVAILIDFEIESQIRNSPEFKEFELDLILDHWQVELVSSPRSENHNISRINIVKEQVKLLKDKHGTNLKNIILLGRLPVPYSGDFAIDGHSPDHKGAWPADAYYVNFTGNWTDQQVTSTDAAESRQHNIPNDGKFDQTQLPGKVEIGLGRIDFYNMPGASKSEVDLIKNYLRKNSLFKNGKIVNKHRAIYDDRFQLSAGINLAPYYSIFNALFGVENYHNGRMIDVLKQDEYRWAYGASPGAPTSTWDIAYSEDYYSLSPKVNFMSLFGSYFGDWDYQDNLLRAALATDEYVVASHWGNRPSWILHNFAMGSTLGDCWQQTINNDGDLQYANWANAGTRFVHIALMGDPTLEFEPIAPIPNVYLENLQGDAVPTIIWQSQEDAVEYFIYQFDYSQNKPVLLTILNNSLFQYKLHTYDPNSTYFVSKKVLVNSPSGTYYKLSHGAVATFANSVLNDNVIELKGEILENPFHQKITIYDAIGNLIYTSNATTINLNHALSNFPTALYFIKSNNSVLKYIKY